MHKEVKIVEIISANESHIESLIHLNGLVQEIHAKKHPGIFKFPIDEDAVKSDFLSAIASDDHLIYVAINGNDVIAYIWAQHVKRDESALAYAASKLYIHHISVSTGCRRNNVGRALMERIEQDAQLLMVGHIALDVWNFNEGASHFFENSGYESFNINMWKRRAS
jgi:ribosomal protein S18 acetylase RimI-like enzyme